MSYDIDLTDSVSGEVLQLDSPHQMKGGTYCQGGTSSASLNVTYNYAKIFYKVLDEEKGIRKLYGMSAAESIPLLEIAASNLKDDVSEDYWEPTEGNAKQALLQLLALARMRPDGVWRGD